MNEGRIIERATNGGASGCCYLSQEAEEFFVGALLGAAVEDHVAQLRLLAGLELHLHQLVGALVVVQTALHRQVDGATQRRQVRFRFVRDDAGVLCRNDTGFDSNVIAK